jgi:hypothetical protein
MGHRFGPDLICTECGRRWELHQVEPLVCEPRGKAELPTAPLPQPQPDDEEPA